MKRKKILLLSFVIGLLLLTGCNNTKNIVCTNNFSEDKTDISTEQTIIYQGKYVKKVKTVEKVSSDDNQVLENYRSALIDYYSEYNKINYYVNTVSIEKNTLINSTIINYAKVDTNKLIKIDKNNKKIIKNKKVKLSTLKKLYEKQGAICK